MKMLKQEPQTKEEEFWLNVGAISTIYLLIFILGPFTILIYLFRVIYQDNTFPINIITLIPGLIYILFFLVFINKLGAFCINAGIKETKAHEKRKEKKLKEKEEQAKRNYHGPF